jgi:hypothetical protein
LNYGKHDLSITPDHPDSLFEGSFRIKKNPDNSVIMIVLGLAGTIYFMADVLTPTNARFPAFE